MSGAAALGSTSNPGHHRAAFPTVGRGKHVSARALRHGCIHSARGSAFERRGRRGISSAARTGFPPSPPAASTHRAPRLRASAPSRGEPQFILPAGSQVEVSVVPATVSEQIEE